MREPSLQAKLIGIDKPITAYELFKYLDEWQLYHQIWVGEDAKRIADIFKLSYPWYPFKIGPHKFTGEFEGEQISHFITLADNLVVWAVFGTSFVDDEPDYESDDFVARIR